MIVAEEKQSVPSGVWLVGKMIQIQSFKRLEYGSQDERHESNGAEDEGQISIIHQGRGSARRGG
jgi:hypothetical protein